MEISQREAEVLAAIGAHQSNAQIANRMHISVRTVESHVSSLLRKFGVTDRRSLAARAEALPSVRPGRFHGLPAERTSFVGRVRERDTVLAALGESRLVTLLGPGGIGKTRLAVTVARAVADDYPAGGAFVDLVPARSPVQAVAEALGVAELPGQPLERPVLDRLRRGRSLLVLDNCEHLIEDAGELVGQVLADCPLAIILATSRERLGVPGERIVAVPPLSDAVELFRARAGAEFAAPPGVIAEICERVDGMPLAIELAAARAASLGADGLLAALEDRLRLLTGGRGVQERHRSLRAVLDWSHDLLDEAERALFRRLSVFAGGFDLDAAAAIHPSVPRAEVADLLGRLVDKSLIVHNGRWWLLDTIRAFARDCLPAAEWDKVRTLHLDWAAHTAAPFEEVADDLRAALARTPPAPGATAHRLARSLARQTFTRGLFREAREHYEAAAERAVDPADACRDLRCAADTAITVADGAAALELLAAEASRAAAPGDALAYAAIASVRYYAPVTGTQRTALLAGAADGATAALLAAARAWDARVTGAPDVLPLSHNAVAAARESGDPILIMGALDILGMVLADAGRMREAHRAAMTRLRMTAGLPRDEPAAVAEIVDAFHVAAAAALGVGDLPGAQKVLTRGETENPVHGHPYITAPMQVRLLALAGEFDEALQRAEALWDGWLRDGSPAMPWMSTAIAVGAMVHGLRGDDRFESWRDRARAMAGPVPGDLTGCLAFVDARIAVHTGQLTPGLLERTEAPQRKPWWQCYARAAGAELAVVTGMADAEDRLRRAEPFAAENDWAAACLTRARGQLHGDAGLLTDAAARFERLGARFEAAATRALLD